MGGMVARGPQAGQERGHGRRRGAIGGRVLLLAVRGLDDVGVVVDTRFPREQGCEGEVLILVLMVLADELLNWEVVVVEAANEVLLGGCLEAILTTVRTQDPHASTAG